MAKLYATSPNGTAKSIQLETMNIESSLPRGDNRWNPGWTCLPNDLIFLWQIVKCTTNGKNEFTYAITIWPYLIVSNVWGNIQLATSNGIDDNTFSVYYANGSPRDVFVLIIGAPWWG